jgi:hypothetical protein
VDAQNDQTPPDKRRDTLIEAITAAFDGISREDGITLHEAEEIDCHGTPEELAAATTCSD